jgi:hypothetical protein
MSRPGMDRVRRLREVGALGLFFLGTTILYTFPLALHPDRPRPGEALEGAGPGRLGALVGARRRLDLELESFRLR